MVLLATIEKSGVVYDMLPQQREEPVKNGGKGPICKFDGPHPLYRTRTAHTVEAQGSLVLVDVSLCVRKALFALLSF